MVIMAEKKKGLQPLPYEFPFKIEKKGKCPEYYFFLLPNDNKRVFYGYWPDDGEVCYRTYGGVIAQDVKHLDDAKKIIYNDYKDKKKNDIWD